MRRKSAGSSESPRPAYNFHAGEHTFRLGRETKIMGILNVTPDSFSDGGLFVDPLEAEARAVRMQDEGAHLVDLGGESTRPGARPVSARQEIRRVRPVLRRLVRRLRIPVSVDTAKEDVARMALDEGAAVINDVEALKGKRALARRIARHRAGVVLMHLRGTPRTMQSLARYRDVLKEVASELRDAVRRALDAGIARDRLVIDPGFGFAKDTQQNLELLANLDYFKSLRLPLLAGLSRKSFIGNVLGVPVEERLYGSVAAAAAAIRGGAHFLRVHDVRAHVQAARLCDRILAIREGGN